MGDLEKSHCIAIENEVDLAPLNLGHIASYYYISYATLELFHSSLTAKTKQRGLLEILCGAAEFDDLPLRPGEEEAVRKLLLHAKVAVGGADGGGVRFTDPHVKANALLQAHFARARLPARDLDGDLRGLLPDSARLLQAMVDVISSNGWLNPALAAMELAQCVAQGLWESDSPLMQLPHFTRERAAAAEAAGVETVFDLAGLDDAPRGALLEGLSPAQQADVARFCNRYPNIDVAFEVAGGTTVAPGAPVTVHVALTREGSEAGTELRPADAPRFPKPKEEGWWLVVADRGANALLAIKRVVVAGKAKAKLEFAAPDAAGAKAYTLFFMCDSYLGADQEYELEINVAGGAGGGDAMAE